MAHGKRVLTARANQNLSVKCKLVIFNYCKLCEIWRHQKCGN